MKIILVSLILILMLSGTIFASTLFGTSHASIPKRPTEVDPDTLANVGVRCGSSLSHCVNTTGPSATTNTGIAVAQQT